MKSVSFILVPLVALIIGASIGYWIPADRGQTKLEDSTTLDSESTSVAKHTPQPKGPQDEFGETETARGNPVKQEDETVEDILRRLRRFPRHMRRGGDKSQPTSDADLDEEEARRELIEQLRLAELLRRIKPKVQALSLPGGFYPTPERLGEMRQPSHSGKIVRVEDSGHVIISLGRADRVGEGYFYFISRDGVPIGGAKVAEVRERESVIVPFGKLAGQGLRVGDKVYY